MSARGNVVIDSLECQDDCVDYCVFRYLFRLMLSSDDQWPNAVGSSIRWRLPAVEHPLL